MDNEETMFDWSVYGALIRRARMDLGYRKAEEFSRSIYRRTRVKVSRDTLYKVEQGRQVPDAIQFMAINMALSGDPFYRKLTGMCMSSEWAKIAEHGQTYIPNDWKVENLEDEGFVPEQFASEEDYAGLVEDRPWLYTDHRTFHDEY